MESAKASLTVYVIPAKVADVKEHFKQTYVSGSGDETVFKSESLGWFVRFKGSDECLYFGDTKPELNIGDKVKITFERTSNAKS